MEAPLGLKKGAWTAEEDDRLRKCVEKYGEGKWHRVPFAAGYVIPVYMCIFTCSHVYTQIVKEDIYTYIYI